jgi:hypothetical protein
MPRADCTVCKHTDVALIDQTLKAGESIRKTAKRFGVSHQAIFRHTQHDKITKRPINIEEIARIDKEIRKLHLAQTNARKRRDSTMALQIAKELRSWFVLKQKAILASIGAKQDTADAIQVPQHELIALARAMIESRIPMDREIQQWVLALAERIQATPVMDAETDER